MNRHILEEVELYPIIELAEAPWSFRYGTAEESYFTPPAEFTDAEVERVKAAFAEFREVQTLLQARFDEAQVAWDEAHPRPDEPFDAEAHRKAMDALYEAMTGSSSWLSDEMLPKLKGLHVA